MLFRNKMQTKELNRFIILRKLSIKIRKFVFIINIEYLI